MRKIIFLIILFPMTTWSVEGGFELKDNQWDGVVHLKSSAGFCSGALINQQWVLTAAHCVDKKDNQEISVFSGLKADNFLSKAHLAFIDPRYSTQYSNYDVALLKLTDKVKYTNNLKVSGSKIYSYLLHGKYPPREVLVAGYGLDERKKLGTRKGAFEKELGIYPGESYIGSFFTLNSIGKTRPGDSGGPIFILTPEGHQLFGVVSGENSYVIKDDDGDIKEHAVRNAPLASSLCLLDVPTQSAIQFDSSYCEKIKQAESKLSKPPQTKEDYLWQAALAVASPIKEVESIRKDIFRRVAISFSKMDSLMARRFIADQSQVISSEFRKEYGLILDAIERYEKSKFSYIERDIFIDWRAYQKFSQSENKTQSAKCGEIVCIEMLRVTDYPIHLVQFDMLNWDFLTQLEKPKSSFDLSKVMCSCVDYPENPNVVQVIIDEFVSLGLSHAYLGVKKQNNFLLIEGKNSDINLTLMCNKENSKYDGPVYVTRLQLSGKGAKEAILNKDQMFAMNQLLDRSIFKMSDYGSYKLMQSSNGKEMVNITSENVVNLLHNVSKNKESSGLLNQVFQCK